MKKDQHVPLIDIWLPIRLWVVVTLISSPFQHLGYHVFSSGAIIMGGVWTIVSTIFVLANLKDGRGVTALGVYFPRSTLYGIFCGFAVALVIGILASSAEAPKKLDPPVVVNWWSFCVGGVFTVIGYAVLNILSGYFAHLMEHRPSTNKDGPKDD